MNGEAFCPSTKIGGDSDPFTVDNLQILNGDGACGSTEQRPGRLDQVGVEPAEPVGQLLDRRRERRLRRPFLRASTLGRVGIRPIVDDHADTDFDSWKNAVDGMSMPIDNDEDFYFIVRTE